MVISTPRDLTNSSRSKDVVLDNSILQRIAAGDESAVEQCLDRYGGLVWSLAQRLCRSDAEDATQEIFVEIWQKASTYDPDRSSEPAFITMIARRRLIDRLRRRDKEPGASSMIDEVVDLDSVSQVDRAEMADEFGKASDCMERLSSSQQKVLAMSIHHGASHAHISERLAMPLGSVKSFARRALIQLRDCMSRPATHLDGSAS